MELEARRRISWKRFKKEFDDRYFLEIITSVGNVMVEQYAASFMKLGRVGPHLNSTEVVRVK